MLRSSEGRYSGSADCEAEGLVGWQAPMRGALLGHAAIRLSGQEGSESQWSFEKPRAWREQQTVMFRATEEHPRGSPCPFLLGSQKEEEFLQ